MSTFEVDINGRVRTVAIDRPGNTGPDGGRLRVLVDGRPVDVDARPTELGLTLLFVDDGRSVEAALTERPGGEWLVQLPHIALSALIDGRRSVRLRSTGTSGAGEQQVSAPMPGRVVRILVKPGDEVAAHQGLVVVEAMKMENELGSPKSGRVKDVAVTEGDSVEAGKLLIVVE